MCEDIRNAGPIMLFTASVAVGFPYFLGNYISVPFYPYHIVERVSVFNSYIQRFWESCWYSETKVFVLYPPFLSIYVDFYHVTSFLYPDGSI
ncbi:hypothetical protein HOY80DRAFT_939037 [Tuber brumale]|nr:hypothetical protein HOY80DRAFT_939037 [Tuber brumale]